MAKELEKITLGGGCFWCTEAVYLGLNGVIAVKSGYSGGHVKNPSYKEVCAETTGHAEVVQITFDSEKQKQVAEKIIQLFDEEKVYDIPIVTEVTEFDKFYIAEDYHINYFARNKSQGYCQFVIAPKMEKFKKIFKDKLKEK